MEQQRYTICKDGDGHQYVIPLEEVEEFYRMSDEIDSLPFGDELWDLTEKFEDTLEEMVYASSYLAVARQLGVSDTAVRKRIKRYGGVDQRQSQQT